MTQEQLELIDIFRKLHPQKNPRVHIFFSSTNGAFSSIDDILRCKTSLNKFKRIEVIPSIFSDQNSMNPEINHMKKNEG